ncbi:Gfo/Idh/MocA family oxidoreductase [Blastopirellula sp. JC732]|uniref:Gfo/Idh/MocA family oxidoreductase n=1 Tax=Blastopirellula sediminis TaxID=2894196 RepID=A0A9X1SEG0_9BACT|nr:Gfo/Idh/MocA family oxidoreductase [Blastopirellula sediminis]MCC9609403.1 Gfo/Idh/MocA family oxidoreductase [Blastopirellula sediminis]MCC9627820.1 Gfo/Idh/MocA family oxidoreductase [Blastopirellula sediminis]
MDKKLTVALHGVTGRMGTNQHFMRSILAIMKQGGVRLASGDMLQVEPILVAREESKLRHLAEEVAVREIGRAVEFTTDLDAVIADSRVDIVFDAGVTPHRPSVIRQAVEQGKAVYCEKPIAIEMADALELADCCEQAGVKNGVVQDKLWLPGIRHLRTLRDEGFFGKILSVRGEFGYWVFSGHDGDRPAQRPSWNYRAEDGGGIIIDMFCHWQYVLNDLLGPIESVLAHAAIDIPERIDEQGDAYACTADDAAYAIFEMASGVICQFNCSWSTRVRRDDLLTIQIDGTHGSAVAGLRDCWVQSLGSTPQPVWNPDIPQPINFYEGWRKLPSATHEENAFKTEWELFLKHVAGEGDFPWSIRSGADGVALAQAGMTSWRERRWVKPQELLAPDNPSGAASRS